MRKKKTCKKTVARALTLGLLLLLPLTAEAQRLLTLDSCRAMALRNNKQMRVAEVRRNVAADVRRSARTKYLPHVSAVGAYEHTSREISLLSDAQKSALGNLGTGLAGELQGGIAGYAQVLPTALQQQIGADLSQMAGALNDKGQHLVDALRTDTRNIWAGSILLTQPLYMGGAIVAANKMADLSEQMVENAAETRRQATLYSVDQAYWQVVSLSHKQRLAESYLELVRKLETDVGKMMTDGVATRSDALSVSVKVNEAEMALTKVTDGLTLSKMLLCQICGRHQERSSTAFQCIECTLYLFWRCPESEATNPGGNSY